MPEIKQDAVTSLFPQLAGSSFCEVNLDEEAIKWRARHPERFAGGANPLLDPAVCKILLDEFHRRQGVEWSYGGYLENRRHVWQGSYLEQTGNFMHLGIDFHVPQGTAVAAPCDALAFLVDQDLDRDGGWGHRVFLKLAGDPPEDVVLIYAHLQGILVTPGAYLARGSIFAEVGGPPENGNWAPHLHIQTISSQSLGLTISERLAQLDGYGPPADIQDLRVDFPDPLMFIARRSRDRMAVILSEAERNEGSL